MVKQWPDRMFNFATTQIICQMEISIRSIILFATVMLTGLSAGLFYAWSVSVIPGTRKVPDVTYLETMQSINRAILNPAFFTVFFGSLICLSIASIYEFHHNTLVFWLMLAASVFYLVGTVGVTAIGNVPLNSQLEALQLKGIVSAQLIEFRKYYEMNWNKLHLIRTIFAVLSFMLSVLALSIHSKSIST